jgi:hypothetical protein
LTGAGDYPAPVNNGPETVESDVFLQDEFRGEFGRPV